MTKTQDSIASADFKMWSALRAPEIFSLQNTSALVFTAYDCCGLLIQLNRGKDSRAQSTSNL